MSRQNIVREDRPNLTASLPDRAGTTARFNAGGRSRAHYQHDLNLITVT